MLLRVLVSSVCLPGLLDGSGAGLPRGHQRCFSRRVVKLTLVTRKADGHLQLAPLLSRVQAFHLKVCIRASKLRAELAHRIRRLLEKLLADGAAFPRSFEYIVDVFLRRMRWQRALKRFIPSRQGAGGW